jgi:hypothetical protein
VEAKSTIKILSASSVVAPRWHMPLNHGELACLLVGELASSWHYPFLSGGLSSTALHLLPLMMSDIARKGGRFFATIHGGTIIIV